MSKIRCKLCNTILESKHVHDYVTCKCGTVLDGGNDYLRMGLPKGETDWGKCIEVLEGIDE